MAIKKSAIILCQYFVWIFFLSVRGYEKNLYQKWQWNEITTSMTRLIRQFFFHENDGHNNENGLFKNRRSNKIISTSWIEEIEETNDNLVICFFKNQKVCQILGSSHLQNK